MPRVVIVAAIRLYRDGLAEILGREPGFAIVGATSSAQDGAAQVAREGPDVMLLDSSLPEGLHLVRQLRQSYPGLRVVVLNLSESDGANIVACAEAGVAGYLGPEATLEDLVGTIRSVERGEINCSPRLIGGLFHRLAAAPPGAAADGSPSLTRRESEIVRLIDHGLSNKEIAGRLGIELATVKNHVHNVLEKLQVRRRGEAAAKLRRTRPSGGFRRPSGGFSRV